ncbi:hypothetical protein BH11ACT3_BH11ACT3_26190 [soil metagenome]
MSIPLPIEFERDDTLHVGVLAPGRALRSDEIIGHKFALESADLRQWHGLPLTSPARTWRDLGAVLTLPALVAAGDYIIQGDLPMASKVEMADAAAVGVRRRGAGRLAAALALLDGRAASPRESHLRVHLVAAGITDFEVNLDVWVGPRRHHYVIDIAFPEAMVAVEYQGEYHHDLAQWRYDMTRGSRLRAYGWEVIEVNDADLADPIELVDRISRIVNARRGR